MSDTDTSGQIQARKPGKGRGCGVLNPAAEARALDMVRAGKSQLEVARELGVTKNTIAGLWNRHGEPKAAGAEPSTLVGRLDALHAKLDRVLAENPTGLGMVRAEPKARR